MDEAKSRICRARQFYSKTTVPNLFQCNICQETKNGTYPSNLVSHFKSKHSEIYANEISIRKEEHIQIQRLKTLHSCVEIVTIGSQSFRFLTSSGFRNALEHQLREYQLAGCALDLSDHHIYEIKSKIHECRSKIEQQIKLETKNQVVSVMVDSATRNGRSIFGVNIQYKYNEQLRLVTLAMCELKKNHTAQYLGDIVVNVLSKYGIKLEQVLTFTTDNGSNMLAMIKNVGKRIFGPSNVDIDEEDEVETAEDDYNFVQAYEQNPDAEALDCLLDGSLEYDKLLEAIFRRSEKNINNRTLFLSSIRCAAHTLQLIVWDALNDLKTDDRAVIELCREVAKFLRLQTCQNRMANASLKCSLPPLDCKTRWSSTYFMVCEFDFFSKFPHERKPFMKYTMYFLIFRYTVF